MSQGEKNADYFGTFLGTVYDHRDRVPDETKHQQLKEAVETLPTQEVQKRFVALLEAVNPNENCTCSDLSEVEEGQAKKCAYHTSRVGWIVHQARQLMPANPES